jgi:hypothetical protein
MSTVRMTGNLGALEAANLLAADKPTWSLCPDTDAGPTGSGSGVSVAGALKTLVAVQIRTPTNGVPRRQVKVTLPVFDAATTYTVNVNGSSYAASGASRAAVLEAITTALNSGSTVAQAQNLDEDEDTFTDAILITGITTDDYYIVPSASAGTGTILAVGDPSSATARVWGLAKASIAGGSVRPASWMLLGTLFPDGRGLTSLYDTGNFERVHVEIVGAKNFNDGTITLLDGVAWVGPTLLGS